MVFPEAPAEKALKHLDKVLGDTGHQVIQAVCLRDRTLTSNPTVVLEKVLKSFQRKYNTADGELSNYTKELISHFPRL